MNYYERHLGDYARDAGHLSMLEHGAYTLLLDRYYTTEQGIPQDQAHRVCRARSKEERAAVDAVLGEFFVLVDGIWTNGRAGREVAKMQTKIEAARANGKRGGRPKKNPAETQEKPTGLSVGSDSETQTKAHQSPDTSTNTRTEARTERGARAVEAEPPEAAGHQPTPAGLICRALRAAGITAVNPGHPMLAALLEAGATEPEFLGLVPKAAGKRDPFAYLLGALTSQRGEAAQAAQGLHRGLLPAAGQPVTVPGTDTRGEAFLAEQDQRAREATRPPKDFLAMARKAVRPPASSTSSSSTSSSTEEIES